MRYHEDLNITRIGAEKNKSFFIPAKIEEDFSPYHWTKSSSVLMLNGDWKIKFFQNFEDAWEYRQIQNLEIDKWDSITVPSCWQTQGFSQNQYINIRYPIPIDPPYVPSENLSGLYYNKFFIPPEKSNERKYISFNGVDSCFYLWVNDKFVGYSQVSHSSVEFDITDTVQTGNNELFVLVLKWCDGTYLEDQDKLRMSGIFGDVYILFRPQNHIRDFRIQTWLGENIANVKVDIELYGVEKDVCDYKIYDPQGKLVAKEMASSLSWSIEIEEPYLWNAETPYLYRLELIYHNEKIVKFFGVKEIRIENSILLFNGQNIKLKGVNRHDSDPYTGYAITKEQLLKDLFLMKSHNINAIRTSHYPNAPWAYDLYDKIGFYVICEADLEAHGNTLVYIRQQQISDNRRENLEQLFFDNAIFGRMMSDVRFEQAILDRVMLCVEREKNATCKIMWSLGNESGYGVSLEKAAKWIKGYDPNTPIQYESMIYKVPGERRNYENIDIYSRMYPSPEVCKHYAENQLLLKPFVCCEYIHSMGNGPGDIEDYWEVFYQYDTLCGGFAWEWCDHAIYAGKDKNGNPKFLYGGDFSEKRHDGNFCVDGLVTPDRKVKNGLLEYKNVLRPVRANLVYTNPNVEIKLTNYMDFTNVRDEIEVVYEIWENGRKSSEYSLGELDIAPHKSKSVSFGYPFEKEQSLKEIRIYYKAKNEKEWYKKGAVLGFDQLFVERNYDFLDEVKKLIYDEIFYEVTGDHIKIYNEQKEFLYTFSKRKAQFTSLKYKGTELLEDASHWNIWRAPTDNDMYIKKKWIDAGYDDIMQKTYKISVEQKTNEIVILVEEALATPGIQKSIDLTTNWVIKNNGEIEVCSKVQKDVDFPELPRFGLRFFLKKDYEQIKYWGLGPYESYIDKRRSSLEGFFTSEVSKEYVDYIKPQEHGSHSNVRKIEISNGKNSIICKFMKGYVAQVSNYSQEQLMEKKHNFELEKENRVIVCLDYKQNGIGSNSCGPELNRKYCFDENEFVYHMKISIRREDYDN